MKLRELLDIFWDGEEGSYAPGRMQVCEPGMEWDDFTEFPTGSKLLEPFLDLEVSDVVPVVEDVVRIAFHDEDFAGIRS